MVQPLCEYGFECHSQESRIKNVKAGRHLQESGVHLPCFTDGKSKTSDKKVCLELKKQICGQAFINSHFSPKRLPLAPTPQSPQCPYCVARISLR